MCIYQLLGHFFDLGDEVGEELGHVLLLAGVQRLFVHGVSLTEGPGVVRLPLTLLRGHNNTTRSSKCPYSVTNKQKPEITKMLLWM